MKRRQSLFGRVFLYTALFAILLVGMTAAVLLPQLFRYRSQARMYRVAVTFNEQFSELYPGEGFQRAAELFITDQEGTILYQSRDAAEVALETSPRHITLPLDRHSMSCTQTGRMCLWGITGSGCCRPLPWHWRFFVLYRRLLRICPANCQAHPAVGGEYPENGPAGGSAAPSGIRG